MKVLIADDHGLFRSGLSYVLRQFDATMEVIEAGTCADTVAAAENHLDLAVIFLDLNMPGGDGFSVLTTLVQRYETLRVVVLSGTERRDDMQRALDAGAVGFISKTSTPKVMWAALRLVMDGGVYVPPQMIQPAEPPGLPGNIEALGLTPRQLDVLGRVVAGKSNKAIAKEIGVSESTVKGHVFAAYRVLRVSNRIQAVRAVEALQLKSYLVLRSYGSPSERE